MDKTFGFRDSEDGFAFNKAVGQNILAGDIIEKLSSGEEYLVISSKQSLTTDWVTVIRLNPLSAGIEEFNDAHFAAYSKVSEINLKDFCKGVLPLLKENKDNNEGLIKIFSILSEVDLKVSKF